MALMLGRSDIRALWRYRLCGCGVLTYPVSEKGLGDVDLSGFWTECYVLGSGCPLYFEEWL